MQILRVAVFFVLLVAVASSEKASPQIISNFDEFYPTESDILSTINPDINADINLTTVRLLHSVLLLEELIEFYCSRFVIFYYRYNYSPNMDIQRKSTM